MSAVPFLSFLRFVYDLWIVGRGNVAARKLLTCWVGIVDERVLPKMLHGEFERRAARGRALLEEVWVEQGRRKRSR